MLLSNGTIAFGLNLSVFLLIGKTSALTMNVAGVIKDWLLIGLSALIFQAQVRFFCTCQVPPAPCMANFVWHFAKGIPSVLSPNYVFLSEGSSHLKCIFVLLSHSLAHLQISALSLGGYGIAFSGVCWYNYIKLQAMQARQAQLAQQPPSPSRKEGVKDMKASP